MTLIMLEEETQILNFYRQTANETFPYDVSAKRVLMEKNPVPKHKTINASLHTII
jgi:hypothetical protein